MTVNLRNRDWSYGVNVQTAKGPDHGGGPEENYLREELRMNHHETWAVPVPDGYDLWYRRDNDPDHPEIPPDFQNDWNHIVNSGEDVNEDIA